MVNISDPTVDEYVELTSSMLEYGGKYKLESLPYFDPDIEFVPELRTKIQDLTYDEKLEVFFNARRFETVIENFGKKKGKSKETREFEEFMNKFSYPIRKELDKIPTDKKKDISGKIHKRTFDADLEKIVAALESSESAETTKTELFDNKILTAHRAEIIKTLKKYVEKRQYEVVFSNAEKNFEFVLQTILCTGFPVSNYYQTMEFYDSGITNTKITLKGAKGVFDFILPSRFKPCFSYIKQNNSIYTSTGVIWLNDALSHPKYKAIIDAHKRHIEEKNKSDDKKKKNTEAIDDELTKLISDIKAKPDIWKEDVSDSEIRNINLLRTEQERENVYLRQTLQKLFLDIRDTEIIKGVPTKKTPPTPDDKKKDKLKNTLKRINTSFIDTLFGNKSLYKNELRKIMVNQKLIEMLYKEDMYAAVTENVSYDNRDKRDIEEIERLMKLEYPNYSEFSNQMKLLEKERLITNPTWRDVAEKFAKKGESKSSSIAKKGESKSSPIDKNELLDALVKCEEQNDRCTKKSGPTNLKYLSVGMDELKTKEEGKALRTFEAYVHIMVAKGKLTEENYTGKICNYMDQVLGDYVQKNWINDDGKEGENFILANTVFVDLTEELKKQDNAQANAANAKTKTKPSTLKKAASIKSESSTQGTKKKKKKKKGSRKKKNA
jgi:hypothetical protein